MIGLIIRFVVSALVLLLVAFLIPGFSVAGFTGALLAAVVIALLGFAAEKIFGEKISPKNRGIVGFITAAVVIFLSQYIVEAVDITWWGALLASFVIGIADTFVPTELR